MQLKGEARSYFAKGRSCTVLIELVPMRAEEDKVSLVVKCHHSARCQVRHLWEKACKHASDSMSEHSVEVVHNELRVDVSGCSTVVRDLSSQLNRGDAESRGGAIRQVA